LHRRSGGATSVLRTALTMLRRRARDPGRSPVPLPTAALHLGALSALAIAEPLFDLIRILGWNRPGVATEPVR
jgi:hypothetical protein